MPKEREFLLADADVLIDYVASDLAILALVSEHIGRVHVLEPTLATVANLSERECKEQCIEVIDGETTLLGECQLRTDGV